ncbi:MAG: phage tail fiber protein [bacterium]
MTVSVLRNKVQYGGNSSTTQFTVNFPYTEKSQILVYLNDTLQTITTHYTLTDPDSTGTVTFVTAPATGTLVTILRETDFLQTTDYANNDILDAETLEAAFDKLTMMCQQVKNLADKAIGFDETVNDTDTTSLKLAAGTADLAGKLLAFDSTGAFVTTQEIGTFRGSDSTTTTASYVVRDLIRDSSNDNVYFTKVNASAGTSLTNTTYFELLVDVETVRTLKEAAETAKTGAETAETNAEAALASFQGQYKTGATNPYSGTPDPGDLWYDSTNSILKYYVSGTGFEPVTTSLATVTGNYLTISNQVITAGVVPVSLGGTGGTSSSEARTLLGLSIGSDIQAYSVSLQDISLLAKTDGNIIVGDGSNWVAESGSTARASLGVSIGSQVQAWDKQLDDISALAVTDGNIIVGNGTTWVAESGATARASLGLTIGTDVEAYSSTNADYSDTTANFTGTLQNGGSNVVVDSDIGSSVQAYDADLTAIAGLSSADGNFIVGSATGWVVESGATVRTSLGLAIGTDVQAYDADTAKYDDTTANFTGTLQNGGSNVLVDSDIGSTVQAAGSYLSDVVSDTTPQLGGNLDVNGSSIVSVSAGNISITPDTTGQIILDGLSWPTADGTTGQVLKTDGAGNLSFVNQSALVVGTANYIEHSSTVSDSLAISSGTNRLYIGNTTFSGSGTMAGYLVISHGYANFTGTVNVDTTGTLRIIG